MLFVWENVSSADHMQGLQSKSQEQLHLTRGRQPSTLRGLDVAARDARVFLRHGVAPHDLAHARIVLASRPCGRRRGQGKGEKEEAGIFAGSRREFGDVMVRSQYPKRS